MSSLARLAVIVPEVAVSAIAALRGKRDIPVTIAVPETRTSHWEDVLFPAD